MSASVFEVQTISGDVSIDSMPSRAGKVATLTRPADSFSNAFRIAMSQDALLPYIMIMTPKGKMIEFSDVKVLSIGWSEEQEEIEFVFQKIVINGATIPSEFADDWTM